MKRLEGAIPLPTERRPEVPAALVEIVQRALLRDPDARFQTAAALQLALEQSGLLGTEPQLSLGEYLSELFGGEQAEARLRRASVWTAPGSGPQPVGTERLGSPESQAPGTDGPTQPARGQRMGHTEEALSPSAPEGLPTVSLGPAATTSASERTKVRQRPSRRWWIPAAALGIAAAAGGGIRLWSRSVPTAAPTSTAVPQRKVVSAPTDTPPGRDSARFTKSSGTSNEVESAPREPLADATLSPDDPAGMPTSAAKPEAKEDLPATPTPPRRRASSVARLNLTANLPAVAFLDGRRLGTLPLSRAKVPAGKHHLRVTATGLDALHEERLVLTGGAALTREVRFAKGKLNIDAEPWADVWVDGARMGQTPLAGREVWEGTHAVRLAGPAGSKTLSVRVRAGRTTVVNEKLAP
jgi:hypothetical protein